MMDLQHPEVSTWTLIRRLGYDHDNYFPDYATAIRAAQGVFVAPINNLDDSYYDASGLRKDTLAAYGLTAPLSEGVTFKIKAYYHDNTGQGTIDVLISDGMVRGAGGLKLIDIDAAFFEALKGQRPLDTVHELAGGDLCRIVFSSGTTGTPKGVPFSVDYLTARVDSARRNWIPAVPFMSLLGLDTVTGFQTFMWAMMNGETFFPVGDGQANLDLIRAHRVASIKTSPARLSDLVDAAGAQPGTTDLTVIEVAGSLLPATVAAKTVEVFGVTPTYLYGSTEVGTVTRGTVDPAHPNMVGTIVDEIQAEIVDDNGTPLPRGIEGMLRFRKPGMPAGYWNVTVPTGHSGFRDGWFYPGDYGQIDADNRLWLSGRRDDLINAGGAKFNLIAI